MQTLLSLRKAERNGGGGCYAAVELKRLVAIEGFATGVAEGEMDVPFGQRECGCAGEFAGRFAVRCERDWERSG
jgi:hypothetical protein